LPRGLSKADSLQHNVQATSDAVRTWAALAILANLLLGMDSLQLVRRVSVLEAERDKRPHCPKLLAKLERRQQRVRPAIPVLVTCTKRHTVGQAKTTISQEVYAPPAVRTLS
jgi:hypothetical protein